MNNGLKKILKRVVDRHDNIGTNNQKTREAWLQEKLEKLPPGISILDAGAGELQYKRFCEHLDYTSQDFGQYNGEGDNKGLQTKKWDNSQLDIVSDIIDIPAPTASFDAILCVEVFEHIPDPAKAVKEFSRLLKPNGKLILTAPFCSMTHFAPYHFATGFNRYFYEKVLADNGFKILEITPNGNYYEYLAQEVQRVPSIAKRYSQAKVTIFERLVLKIMLNILNKYNKSDTGSSELLCFGYHVLAEKIY